MRCPQCDTHLHESENYCPTCGRPIGEDIREKVTEDETITVISEFSLLYLALAVLAVIAVFVFFLS